MISLAMDGASLQSGEGSLHRPSDFRLDKAGFGPPLSRWRRRLRESRTNPGDPGRNTTERLLKGTKDGRDSR